MKKPALRKHLSLPGLLTRVRSQFQQIKDPLSGKMQYGLVDCLMSGLALFGLKYASLLKFDEDCRQEAIINHNMATLYQVKQVPSDTYLRERLDEVEPSELQRGINRIIAQCQRSKVLESYSLFEGYYLVAIDGTGYFSSHEIHCASCCVKQHRNGSKTYYHQMLAAVLVHPELKTVLPLALEPIIKQDGRTKNDGEHTALKRLLVNLRRAHPHLKLLVTLDGLYADGVIIKLLKSLAIRFIISAKPNDLKYLFESYQAAKPMQCQEQRGQLTHQYKWVNPLPLNDSHEDCQVNVLCYQETLQKTTTVVRQQFSWLSDITLTAKTVAYVMREGRTRWRIESATQAHKVMIKGFIMKCSKAVGKMMVGPSKSAVRSRFQTTPSGCY